MDEVKTWNPFESWKPATVKWIKVNISREDLARFTQRSNLSGLCQAIPFLLLFAVTGFLAYLTLANKHYVLFGLVLLVHGTFYGFFGSALHELSHNTVFSSRFLNRAMTFLYGWLYWPYNPYLYRLSHHSYHHRYTLHQGSDGEDTPNYLHLNARLVFDLFFRVLHVKALVQNVARLVTLKPASNGWRGRGYPLDTWEAFVIKNASEDGRKSVHRFAVFCLVSHVLFVAVCLYFGLWLLPVLITFAPFYGAGFMGFIAGVHQHTACEANNPDFKVSCGDAILDPLTSFLYWRMEYHMEHHMYAGIPCYNLKKFSRFVAAQLPPKEHAIPRILNLHKTCKEKYGSYQYWRDNFGMYKGF